MTSVAASSQPSPTGQLVNSGFFAALTAYGIWGVSAFFFHALDGVPPAQIIAHRVIWSLLALSPFVTTARRRAQVLALLRNPRSVGLFMLTALLVSTNWLVFVYAIAINRAVEASLGYYILPLFSVVLAALFLKERFTPRQAAALALVVLGVVVLVIGQGTLPWISFALAVSFGFYGLLRKIIPVEAMSGLFVETLLLSPFALAYLLWCEVEGSGAIGVMVLGQDRIDLALLLILGCPLWTALPLFLFGFAARALRLSTIGLIQYINPTLQFLVATVAFREHFTPTHAVTFALIWAGITVYSWPKRSPTPKEESA